VALLLSILIEGVVNYFMLRKRHQPKRIIGATILVNLASYLLGSIVLYAFSFS
jgi:hydrogenase-4 membrane subunit HyfE